MLIITPQRNLKPETEATRCQGYALSLFDTRENAENRYLKLTKNRKKLRDSLGTHIAAGAIDKTDGVVSKIDDNGHLSLHEFATADLAAKFVITSCFL